MGQPAAAAARPGTAVGGGVGADVERLRRQRPTGQLLSAWIAKEELRALSAIAARGGDRGEIRVRLWAFYRWCADAQIPELTTLAETIETWWPAIEVFLNTGITNARTEGTNS